MTGQTLGHYRILEKIGVGGMGEVYRARDDRLERDVAVKVLPQGTLANESVRKRLRKEALILSKLSHPNIEILFEFGNKGQVEFLVVEYVAGVTLSDMLTQGPLSEKEITRLGVQLANGLAAAHAERVVHRDLKPGNLRITPDGRVKILDFGVAKLLRPKRETTGNEGTTESTSGNQAVIGTLPYMAPEQLRSESADARTDIYAAGAVLYEMASGQRAFREEAAPRLIDAILHQSIVPPRAVNARISPELERIILKCLEKEPENRYQSARELEVDLRQLAAPGTARAISLPGRAPIWWRRAGLAAAFAVALVAMLVGLNVSGWRDRLLGGHGLARIESLAVLPLENLSGNPDQDYFADGMTEELITDLAKIKALRVISRTSVMRYKGERRSLPEIARELNVEAVVEGTVLRSGDRVRITAQLIHAPSDRHLWAESYERNLRDVLALQREVATAITHEIQIKLTSQDQARLSGARSVNPEAYEAYLKGRYYWNKRSEEGLGKAISYFQQAIDKDPTYARAYAGLADCYSALGSNRFLPPKESFPKAKAAALKALEMDENLAEAHASLAFAIWNYDFDWVAVESEYKRAIELNPGYATNYHWYAGYLSGVGRHAEAIAAIKKARKLDPLSPRINANVGFILYFARQYDQAIEELRRALEMDPSGDAPYLYLGMVYLQKGNYPEAIAALEKSNQLLAGRAGSALDLAYAYAVAGKREEAQKMLSRLVRDSKQIYEPALWVTRVYAALGEKEKALTWLQKAYEERSTQLTFLKVDPTLDTLRPELRFQALLSRMKLQP